MKITGKENEKAILAELGQRIKQQRIALGITQTELAEKCGISPSTQIRIESGDDSKLSNYIKIMSGLKMLDNIDILIPEVQPNFKMIYENRRIRQRVKTKKAEKASTWVWGEDK